MNPQTSILIPVLFCLMCDRVLLAPHIILNGTNTHRTESVSEILSRVNPVKPWLIEGDIAVKLDGRSSIAKAHYWPNGKLIYSFHPTLPDNIRQIIRKAMESYEGTTCVRFVERTTEKNFVQFQNTDIGCWSYIGVTNDGLQELNLGKGCEFLPTALHEIGHALGLFHEQSRPDRDQYISIIYQNIEQGKRDNFKIASNSETFDIPYDFVSIMHYDQHAFGKGKITMLAKAPYTHLQDKMGTGKVLTWSDVDAINEMYCY